MKEKLNDSRGETLVEVLASIVVAALSVALLFGGIMASSTIDRGARASDGEFYGVLSLAEEQSGPGEPLQVEVTQGGASTALEAARYGGEGAYSYAGGAAP